MFGSAAAVFAGLLIITGFAKVRRPLDTSRALAALGLPQRQETGLALGFVEVIVGASVLVTMGRAPLIAQGLLYLAFIGWLGFAMLKKAPISSCGCLGTPDTPPYPGHLTVDAIAAASSFATAFSAGPVRPSQPLGLLAFGTVVIVGTFLAWAVIGDGARLYGSRQ